MNTSNNTSNSKQPKLNIASHIDAAQHNQQQPIFKLFKVKDVIGYMLFNYLKPQDIMSCYLAHRKFHALPDFKLKLVKQTTKQGIGSAIEYKDNNLLKYIFKIHQLQSHSSICYRGDMMLQIATNAENLFAFKFILAQPKLDLSNNHIGEILIHCATSYRDHKCDFLYTFLNWCTDKQITLSQLQYNPPFQPDHQINVIDSILLHLVTTDRPYALPKLKYIHDTCNIQIPTHIIAQATNTTVTQYIKTLQ